MKKVHLTTVTDIVADHRDIYARSVVVFLSSKVGFEYILVDVKTKEKSHKNLSSYGFWRRARDSIRATAVAWSLAVTTVHRTVALYRSSFESLLNFCKQKSSHIKRCNCLFHGGEQGIRTLEQVIARYTISNRAPSTSSDNSPYLQIKCLYIIYDDSEKIKCFFNFIYMI